MFEHPVVLSITVLCLSALVAAGIVWFKRHQLEVSKVVLAEAAEKRRRASEEKTKLEERVSAGTHTETGKAKCRIVGCEREAGYDRAHVVHDELSFRSFVRRRFGAARRWEAAPPEAHGGYCGPCAVLGSQVVEHGISQATETVASTLLEQDASLAHLESDGVDARVAELNAEQRARASLPPSSIKPIASVGTAIGPRRLGT